MNAGALALALLVAASTSAAQTFPGGKPVRWINGFPPGGFTDNATRIVAARLGELWGSAVVVEDRPGASSTIAAALVAKAQPDGYTLFTCSLASHGIAPSLYRNLQYDPIADFTAIARIGTTPNVLVVNNSLPARSVSELIAYAKANPGRLSVGSSDRGSSQHLSTMLFMSMAGIEVLSVPYKGGSLALTDLYGGQLDAMMAALSTVVGPVQGGKIRALGVTSAARTPQAPQLPTIAESGLPGFDVTSWTGVCGPARMAKAMTEKISADIGTIVQEPATKQRLLQQGIDAAPMSADELAALIKGEIPRWAALVRQAGVVPQ